MKVKKEKNREELYHITHLKNLDNILLNGLMVNSSNNGFVPRYALKNYTKKYGMQPIFLTQKPKDVYTTQLTDTYVKKNNCIILKVNPDGLIIEDEYEYLKTNPSPYKTYEDALKSNIVFGRDFISRNNIEPDRIKVFS